MQKLRRQNDWAGGEKVQGSGEGCVKCQVQGVPRRRDGDVNRQR
jgi:hypothetical protein